MTSVPSSGEITFSAIECAHQRISEIAIHTPLIPSAVLSEQASYPLLLKLECLQTSGSFKVRGAANCILGLDADSAARGVVTCSSGNHGLAVATVAAARGIPGVICVPEWVDPTKLRAIRGQGAEVVVSGATFDEADMVSREIESSRGLTYVHAFDHPQVIAGQGTIGIELVEDCAEITAVIVAVSGGGLISGIAVALRAINPEIRVIGAYAETCASMVESVRAGKLVDLPEKNTIATALSGGLGQDNAYSFNLVAELVDEFVAITEKEILGAMATLYEQHRLIVEGGGAVAAAAAISGRYRSVDGPLAVVVSGGNIELGRFVSVIDEVRQEHMTA